MNFLHGPRKADLSQNWAHCLDAEMRLARLQVVERSEAVRGAGPGPNGTRENKRAGLAAGRHLFPVGT